MKYIYNPKISTNRVMFIMHNIVQRMVYPLIHIWLKYYHDMDDDEINSLFCSPQIVNMRDYNDNIEKLCIGAIKNGNNI